MTHAEESRRESFDKVKPRLPGMRGAILDLLKVSGNKTAWEISNLTGWLMHSVSARLTELKKAGHVVEVGRRYNNGTDTAVTIYALAPTDAMGPINIPAHVNWKKRALAAERDLKLVRLELEAAGLRLKMREGR